MKFIRSFAALFLIVTMLFGPAAVYGCPLCADAIADANAKGDQDEIDDFPAAMNQSIYLMLAVPYSAMGIVSFCVYRGVKKNEEFRNSQGETNSEPEA